jgi:DNA-binding transcriptional LysR family regulator
VELRQLEHFLAVARHGGFTAAARELRLVQSALSTSIRKLEHEVGTPLFDRTTRRVVLTEAGTALLPVARRVLADVTTARDAIAAVTDLASGGVSIGTIQTLTVVDLPDELSVFRLRHPGVRIHVRDGKMPELFAAVAGGELDLSFVGVVGPLPDGLTSFARWPEEHVVICAPGHRLARRRRVRLAELDDEPFVEFAGSELQRRFRAEFATAGLHQGVTCEVTHVPLLLDLVAAGLGVTILPRPLAQRSGLPHATLVEPTITREIHLIGRPPEPVNPAARALLAHLTARSS